LKKKKEDQNPNGEDEKEKMIKITNGEVEKRNDDQNHQEER
jgi:hypothetical protein